ncbi:hypothetical protein TKK_0009239 [Trichogramma kaykai]
MTTNEVIVDALPYIDQGYDDPGIREAAVAMVEEEIRRFRPTKNYLENVFSSSVQSLSFETDILKHEFERLQNRQSMEVINMKRYELPPPTSGKLHDATAWLESVDNSNAQLEHQATRITNLELMLQYGCCAWKAHLKVLAKSVADAQKQLADIKKNIQEINWQRKSNQTQGGEKLKALDAEWVGLVSKNYEIEKTCVYLENKINEYEMYSQQQQQVN